MVGSIWIAFTVVFSFLAFTDNPNQYAGYSPRILPEVHRGPPLAEQSGSLLSIYVDWLVKFTTFGWEVRLGEQAEPVTSILAESLGYTLVYLVPSMLFAVVVGTGIRLYTVSNEGSRLNRMTDVTAFLAVSVPSFLLAHAMKWWLLPYYFELANTMRAGYDTNLGIFAVRNLGAAVWPATAMTLYLFGIQLRYAGTELEEYVSAEFVKTARAKGASVWRVGLHIFRNAAIPLLTLFFTDMLGLTFLGIYVIEWVSRTPGIGSLTIDAVGSRVRPLLFLVVMLPVVLGVVVNFLQDAAYVLFDPRVDYDD